MDKIMNKKAAIEFLDAFEEMNCKLLHEDMWYKKIIYSVKIFRKKLVENKHHKLVYRWKKSLTILFDNKKEAFIYLKTYSKFLDIKATIHRLDDK